jgi:hypothetical protein
MGSLGKGTVTQAEKVDWNGRSGMNNTSKALMACLAVAALWIAFQNAHQPKPKPKPAYDIATSTGG